MADGNFIKIDRNILNWGWYSDVTTKVLFLHCLLKANWKDGVFQNQPCKRGQFVTSLSNLSKEIGISIQQARTALEHLKSTGEVTSTVYSKYRIITVINYEKYQSVNNVSNKQSTSIQQAEQQTSNNNRRKKEVKKERNKEERDYARARPTLADVILFCQSNQIEIDCERFWNYYESTDWKTTSGQPIEKWQAIAKNWGRSERKQIDPLKTDSESRPSTYEISELEEFNVFTDWQNGKK